MLVLSYAHHIDDKYMKIIVQGTILKPGDEVTEYPHVKIGDTISFTNINEEVVLIIGIHPDDPVEKRAG